METEYRERGAAIMKRLIIVCEGPTEQEFCKDVLFDYFIKRDICIEAPIIKHSGGGVVPWPMFLRQIIKHLYEKEAYVSMLVDYYGIKDFHCFPKWEEANGIANHEKRIEFLEDAMLQEIPNSFRYRFIPYLQLHEFESLLFSDISAFEKTFMESELEIEKLQETASRYSNPEEINNNPNTSPSKRLMDAVVGYNKVLYGNFLAMEIGLDKIMSSCPHFRKWIETLAKI